MSDIARFDANLTLFYLHESLPKRLRDALRPIIKEHGGVVTTTNDLGPSLNYILVDFQSKEGRKFAQEWRELGPSLCELASWTYVTACVCEDSLVNPDELSNIRPALIDPDSRQPLLVNINSSLDGLAKASWVEKIGRNGGLVVSRTGQPRVIICHPDSGRYHQLRKRFNGPNDPFVELPTWLHQCITQGCVIFPSRKQPPRPAEERRQFTIEDRDNLVAYIGTVCPLHVPYASSRGAPKHYRNLVANVPNYPWAVHHTWQSWRDRYQKFKSEMDPLIDRWVRRNKSTDLKRRGKDVESTHGNAHVKSSSSKQGPPPPRSSTQMIPDLNFSSDAEPGPSSGSESKSTTRKRKASGDHDLNEAEMVKKSRLEPAGARSPKASGSDSELNQSRAASDKRILTDRMSTKALHDIVLQGGPYESSSSQSHLGQPPHSEEMSEFPPFREAHTQDSRDPVSDHGTSSMPQAVSPSARKQAMGMGAYPLQTPTEPITTPRTKGLKSEGSVFWSSSPQTVKPAAPTTRQKSPLSPHLATPSRFAMREPELFRSSSADHTADPTPVSGSGETTEEEDREDYDDVVEVRSLVCSSPRVAPSESPESHQYATEEKGKARAQPQGILGFSDDDVDGAQTQAMLAHRQRAIDIQPTSGEVTEEEDSQPGTMTQEMIAYRQRAIGGSGLTSPSGSRVETIADVERESQHGGESTQALLAHRQRVIASGKNGSSSEIVLDERGFGSENANFSDEDAETRLENVAGPATEGLSAHRSSSRSRGPISNGEAPSWSSSASTPFPSHKKRMGDVREIDLSVPRSRHQSSPYNLQSRERNGSVSHLTELVINDSVSTSVLSPENASSPRIPPAFVSVRNRRIAKALAKMAKKFDFIPEDVLDTYNFFGGDLQKTHNLLERNRRFLDEQSQCGTQQ
ncbi:uncharacterized protein EI90DRAFT_2488262 [Cantharellus anzutake]|uniref:uncharacterized protein n=1 Tax=Cantharellus anzutake TaxID=1750568 RepID=UPI00190339ED|nr:uncharacterized protein EI90DRAFT_2488262 [Cantharellus anzutake]KAF8321979.1 hypothetical protein EI90DRAFT_2488262 [Cantharellus anzutake]